MDGERADQPRLKSLRLEWWNDEHMLGFAVDEAGRSITVQGETPDLPDPWRRGDPFWIRSSEPHRIACCDRSDGDGAQREFQVKEGYVVAGKVFERDLEIAANLTADSVAFEGGELLARVSLRLKAGLPVRLSFAGTKFHDKPRIESSNLRELRLTDCTSLSGFDLIPPPDGELSLERAIVHASSSIGSSDSRERSRCKVVDMGGLKLEQGELTLRKLHAERIHADGLTLNERAVLRFEQINHDLSLLDAQPGLFGLFEMRSLKTVEKNVVSFRDVELSRARFAGTNLEKIELNAVVWARLGARECLFEEVEELAKGSAGFRRHERDHLSESYRQLVLNHEAKWCPDALQHGALYRSA